MIYSGINTLSADSCFIRLKDKPEFFIHFEGDNPENPEEEVVYRAKEGTIGAAVWNKKKGERFIKLSGAPNLELVSAREVLGTDSSIN